MKFVFITVFVLASCSVATQAQSCLTQDDVRQLLARIDASPPPALNKKFKEELTKMAAKEHAVLLETVEKSQTKKSDQQAEKLNKTYEEYTAKLCQLLKTHGWPTTSMVDKEGIFAAFYILKNGTFELQRDLLPVIVAVVKKDPPQKREFAGLYDRLRVSAGRKQLFGTQAVISAGFLVLYPIEDPTKLDSRRAEFGLVPMEQYMKNLEREYFKPLVRARQPPNSQLSKQLTESLGKAIDETQLGATEIDPNDVIKTETNLVSLNVSVFNNKSKTFVGSLAKEDFRVLENNQEQAVTYFASTDMPFDLVLLIDLSGSTMDKRDLIRKSTLRFIEAARPTDRVAIVTFSHTVNVLSPLTLDRVQLAASVGTMEETGGSNVWDAIKFALDNVVGTKSLERRRAVVLMSDGLDGALMSPGTSNGSQTPFRDLLEQVRQTDTLIVPIFLDTEEDYGNPWQKSQYQNARNTLDLLARESGGTYYRARKLSDLNGVYEQVINDLGKVYSIGYKPTNTKRDGSWRWVQVAVANRPDLVARTRPGYYAQ